MRVTLCNPTGRKTPAHRVTVGPHTFFFSYETCIAYAGPGRSIRCKNYWGPTTGRHFNDMVPDRFEIADTYEEFERVVADCFSGNGAPKSDPEPASGTVEEKPAPLGGLFE